MFKIRYSKSNTNDDLDDCSIAANYFVNIHNNPKITVNNLFKNVRILGKCPITSGSLCTEEFGNFRNCVNRTLVQSDTRLNRECNLLLNQLATCIKEINKK